MLAFSMPPIMMHLRRSFPIVLMVLASSGYTLNISGRDIFKSAKDLTLGTVQKVPDLIPSPEALFDSGKQLVAGYPFEVVSTAINKICSTAISSSAVKPRISPDIQNMKFLLMTPKQNYSYPILEAERVWKSEGFDKDKEVVVLVTGWTTNVDDNGAIYAISRGYFCRGGVNFIVVDTAQYVDTLYTWSAFNTEELGMRIAEGLVKLIDYVPLEKVHLIGHSLGAHIVGSAGRTFYYKTEKLIPRITGLDPAKPCFNEGEALSGLQRGDAAFIDVIHSNSGVLGKRDPTGDVDFYPGGLSPIPPGCLTVTCAHARAWMYYAETVYPGNENNFLAIKCNSLTRLQAKQCPGKSYPMGYGVPKNIRGNYFLEVNGDEPFGKNAKPTQPTCTL